MRDIGWELIGVFSRPHSATRVIIRKKLYRYERFRSTYGPVDDLRVVEDTNYRQVNI